MDVDEDDTRPVNPGGASFRARWQWQNSNRTSFNSSTTTSPPPGMHLPHVASTTSINGGPAHNTIQPPAHPQMQARQPSALANAFVAAARVPAAQFSTTQQFDRQTTLIDPKKYAVTSAGVEGKTSPSASISGNKFSLRTNIGEYFDLSRSARRRHILLSLAACVFIALAIVGLYYLSKYERPQHYDLIAGPVAYPANSTTEAAASNSTAGRGGVNNETIVHNVTSDAEYKVTVADIQHVNRTATVLGHNLTKHA